MRENYTKRTAGQFTFREVRTKHELLDTLRLRYAVYTKSRLSGFCAKASEELDVDCYDANARHFGLYVIDGDKQKLVGSLRVVEKGQTEAATMLKQLAHDHSAIDEVLQELPKEHFPLLTYGQESNNIKAYLADPEQQGVLIVEPGRLILSDAFRSIRLARFIIESSLAIYFFSYDAIDKAVLGCCRSQKRFYIRYGFCAIPGTSDNFWDQQHVSGSVLVAAPTDVPSSCRVRLQRMADEFDRTGMILCQNNKKVRRSSVSQAYQTDTALAGTTRSGI